MLGQEISINKTDTLVDRKRGAGSNDRGNPHRKQDRDSCVLVMCTLNPPQPPATYILQSEPLYQVEVLARAGANSVKSGKSKQI